MSRPIGSVQAHRGEYVHREGWPRWKAAAKECRLYCIRFYRCPSTRLNARVFHPVGSARAPARVPPTGSAMKRVTMARPARCVCACACGDSCRCLAPRGVTVSGSATNQERSRHRDGLQRPSWFFIRGGVVPPEVPRQPCLLPPRYVHV